MIIQVIGLSEKTVIPRPDFGLFSHINSINKAIGLNSRTISQDEYNFVGGLTDRFSIAISFLLSQRSFIEEAWEILPLRSDTF